MGNTQAVPCAGAVTATPGSARLTERDVTSLAELYKHDEELLQLMCAAELLRDTTTALKTSSDEFFRAMNVACRQGSAFGDKLSRIADAQNTTKLSSHVPREEENLIPSSRRCSASRASSACWPVQTIRRLLCTLTGWRSSSVP